MRRAVSVLLLLTFCALASAQDVASFEKRIAVKKLENGLTLLICERPEAPVFSFFTMVDVGSVQDPVGYSGLAHMFEHMAFKGTPEIGTTDWDAERAALAKVEAAFLPFEAMRRQEKPDRQQLAALKKALDEAIAEADKYVVKNAYDEIVSRNGAVGVNASTSEDETVYFFSMPSNRLELWAYLESERYLRPVMREFYKERDVVVEERRMRIDSSPIGRMVEQFLAAAYEAHPYGRSGVGWMSEVSSFSATDAAHFYETYYVPANMVVAVVGDVKTAELMPLLERYFGRLPSRPKPLPLSTREPMQNAERIIMLKDRAQPFYLEGYHRPDYTDPDDAVYDAIGDLLSNGRTSRLYRALVRDKKIAAFSEGFSGFPGTKYPHLFAFFAVPLPGHTPEEMQAAIHEEIERVKNTDVTDEELQMIKTRAKANLIRGLNSNSGLASELAVYQTRYGDWRELFRSVDRIEKVTKADIRRVASKTFVETNRTVAFMHTTSGGPPARMAPPPARKPVQPPRPAATPKAKQGGKK